MRETLRNARPEHVLDFAGGSLKLDRVPERVAQRATKQAPDEPGRGGDELGSRSPCGREVRDEPFLGGRLHGSRTHGAHGANRARRVVPLSDQAARDEQAATS